MLQHIGKRALQQPVQGDLMAGGNFGGHVPFLECHVDLAPRGELADVGSDRGDESEILKDRRTQIEDQPPDRVDGMRNQSDRLGNATLDPGQFRGTAVHRNHLQVQLEQHQIVADFVVQVL